MINKYVTTLINILIIMALHTKITLRPPCPSQMTVINTESKCYQECKQGCVLLYCW